MRCSTPLHQYIIKVASACNLNCSYCYVYNKGDQTFSRQPKLMPESVFLKTIDRIKIHAEASGQSTVLITFHGGEPTLLSHRVIESWCDYALGELAHFDQVRFDIQTNGTLLSKDWLELIERKNIGLTISIDGPKELHDRYRIDHKGNGSYDSLIKSISSVASKNIPFALLSVIPLGYDPISVYKHLRSLQPRAIGFLFPAETHDTISEIKSKFGETPVADFLIPIFDEWFCNWDSEPKIREIWNILRLIMGGTSQLDSFGNPPLQFLAIQPNGDIEGLDKLRVCGKNYASTGLNVIDADFADVEERSPFHRKILQGPELPSACTTCIEAKTCGGGYIPNRFSSQSGFDNASVWCDDIKAIFSHIRSRLDIDAKKNHQMNMKADGLATAAYEENYNG